MVSVTMATSEWIQFFKEAGIPPGPAVSYAVMFVDNRIRKNMLLDLTKELMNELGITVVGDVIAILKHAKVVHRQEMCKAATDLLCPGSSPLQADLRRSTNSAASRMIANSLSREALPNAPLQPHGSKISITVPNQPAAAKAGFGNAAAGIAPIPVKRRRVTAEMEGKYIITMPKGTTPRTRKILEQQQAAKGLPRASVFDRLGAEAKGDPAAGGKPSGVFSRLGDSHRDKSMGSDEDDDGSALPYAGVLKKPKASRKESAAPGMPVTAPASSSEAKAIPSLRNGAGMRAPGCGREDEDAVSSSSSGRENSKREWRVLIRRTWGCGKGSSSEARMDSAGSVSVFQRLGKKPD
ncbi:uncharacterized protein C19orf47 homolog [Melopsittacus undulatus]|uniref:uncharacterized protein C19orf47 homolog n=1 Tax=Melopsittacus undulatus TaxID=13146 RepID=UPI00146D08E5|nr:uncharacterized protein C19orf47 homolog [Melopsittacus undulatus]XP_033928025.1 uncharacterized protein C19orf47 homolog [Melopsittacus undulatus]